jgi:hypothetical protein
MKARWILLALAALFVSGTVSAYDYDDDRYNGDSRYGSQRRINCDSTGNRTEYCDVDTRGGVRLARQNSRAACIEGQTWGWDRRGVWVTNGCRGEFEVYGSGRGRGWDDDDDDYRHGGGYGGGYYDDRNGRVFTCASNDGRYNYCSVNAYTGRIFLRRQLSKAACIEGQTWGADNRGVWVSNGCRGEFEVDRQQQQRYVGVVRCESNDGRFQFCAINSGYGSYRSNDFDVRLRKQLSKGACIQNHSWGYDHRGLWVSNGCRAEFDVFTRGGGRRW